MNLAIFILSVVTLFGCAPAQQATETKIAAEPAAEQTAPAPKDAIWIEKFLGKWQSTGDAFGQPAVSTMVWTLALEGRFIRLDYSIDPPNKENAKSIFSGVAYYKMGDDGSYTAFWADTSGDLHPLNASFADNTLTTIWGVEGEKLGKTRYALGADGNITVTDWIMRDGEFRQFHHNTFAPVGNAQGFDSVEPKR
ncbi:MAG: hypothetical protein EX271_01735 [Acidimicrobiales bacterium]|nr:hypothetical protein [Hyphomonadaceae bacterium]RZV44433.1 MAG: hypothetical protein EX271_01735 [Acidimicrobiales bacterium]